MKLGRRYFFSFSILGILLGCGGQPGEAVSQDSPTVPLVPQILEKPLLPGKSFSKGGAELLGLRIIPDSEDGKNPDLPDPTALLSEKTFWDDFTLDGNDILIHRKLFLPDPLSPNPVNRRHLFFVWSDTSFGSPLVAAFYSHGFLDSQEKSIGNLSPRSAWHDTERHRWFIPLDTIYRDRESYEESSTQLADIQILTLELAPEVGPRQIVRVRYQAVGAFPQIVLTPLELQAPPKPSLWVKEVSHRGAEIYEEQVINPVQRSFRLWVRGIQETPGQPELKSLTLSTYLSMPQYQGSPSAAPLGPDFKYFQSRAYLEIKKLVVLHEDQSKETYELQPGKWVGVVLRGGEKTILQWWALPSSTTSHCHLPTPREELWTWQTHFPQTYHPWFDEPLFNKIITSPPGITFYQSSPSDMEEARKVCWKQIPDPPRPPVLNHTKVPIVWSTIGGAIRGEWGREIRLAHDFTSERDATLSDLDFQNTGGSREFLVLDSSGTSSGIKGELVSGKSVEKAADYPCQGIFK